MSSLESAKLSAQQAAHSDTIELLARFGYAVKGVVYFLVGVLAVMAAIGSGGQTSGSKGAIAAISEAPFGQVLLWVVAVGLGAYTLWRFVQAFLDPDNKGSDAEGFAKRAAYFVSGLLYAGVTVWLVQALLSGGSPSSGSGGSSGAQDWTATVMQQPFGRWLVGIGGAIVIGYGLRKLYKAYTADFFDKFKTGEMSTAERRVLKLAGQAGLAARGVVFGIIGGFLIDAALSATPGEAKGLGGALDTLAAQPYGPWLLGAVALGLAAYGIYCVINARYRQIPSG